MHNSYHYETLKSHQKWSISFSVLSKVAFQQEHVFNTKEFNARACVNIVKLTWRMNDMFCFITFRLEVFARLLVYGTT